VTLDGLRVGEASYQLEPHGDGYRYHGQSHAVGIAAWFRKEKVQEQSEWILHQGRIRPLFYRYERTGGNRDRLAVLEFDWDEYRVENRVEGRPWRMDIPEGTMDKLLVNLAVMLDLQQGKREMEYAVADGGRLKRFRYRVLGEDRVETPAGTFETLKMERIRLDRGTRTEIWTAPALRYLPVRMQQQEDEGPLLKSELDEFSDGLRSDQAARLSSSEPLASD
jgi:hypothetical protein